MVTGLQISRHFTKSGVDPYSLLEWENRTVEILGEGNRVVFRQEGVEVPKSWSMVSTQITAQKYFRGTLESPERERSVRGLVDRVADTITDWGRKDGYFRSIEDADVFSAELKHILVNQKAAFNSPVWFNVGVEKHPQASACFINSVQDSMDSILDLCKTEGMLFKYGSGTGSNLSVLRGSKEKLKGGGEASGPVPFMRGYDAFAGAMKSGGKTRRAAKMVILNADHPDIFEFVRCKAIVEKMAHVLVDNGYNYPFNDPRSPYNWLAFQNANHSVRVTDEFMYAVVPEHGGGSWDLKARTTGEVVQTIDARKLFGEIAEAARVCGDPGLQFHSTINRWNPCKVSGSINSSNPCSEYMFLDDTACNLASLRLTAFLLPDGSFDIAAFLFTVDIITLAMEVIVGNASYPTEAIAENSRLFRPLGVGYADLGALLMRLGVPYDSNEGRAIGAVLMALLHCRTYRRSAEISRDHGGPFTKWKENADCFNEVLQMHRAATHKLPEQPNATWKNTGLNYTMLRDAAIGNAEDMCALARSFGVRNSQATVLAPTGTIGFMMGCDTTGVEPDTLLKKTKLLVGGGSISIVNESVRPALIRMGYSSVVEPILEYIDKNRTAEGCEYLDPEDVAVFDTALSAHKGGRVISWQGHLKMMEAVQPFISGAISKTVNMPSGSSADDVAKVYTSAWMYGLKAIAVYPDEAKRSQPLSSGHKTINEARAESGLPPIPTDTQAVVSVSGNVDTTSFKKLWDKTLETATKTGVWRVPIIDPDYAGQCDTCHKDLKNNQPIVTLPDGNTHHYGCYKPAHPYRRKLPEEVQTTRVKFKVGNHKGYFMVGHYPDGTPGEVWIIMNKDGSLPKGLCGALSQAISIGLQFGVPLETYVEKFSHVQFEPSGFTGNQDIPLAKSILDYVFRWLGIRYLGHKSSRSLAHDVTIGENQIAVMKPVEMVYGAPSCSECGRSDMMQRNGSCYCCRNCGATNGCS